MLDLVCLRSFVHVCERGTIAAAAADLGYTAPAVSQHVAKLERDVGVAVFDRVGGRLRPSAAGDELLAMAAAMLDLEEHCRRLAATTPQPAPVVIAAFRVGRLRFRRPGPARPGRSPRDCARR